MSEHTPEPWKIVPHDEEMPDDGFEILGSDGETACDDGSAWGEYSRKMSEANARRIVACVNACLGMETKWLEEFSEFASSGPPLVNLWNNAALYRDQLGKSLRERNEARAMVKDLSIILKAIDGTIESSDHWWMDCPDRGGFNREAIQAAIAKAETLQR